MERERAKGELSGARVTTTLLGRDALGCECVGPADGALGKAETKVARPRAREIESNGMRWHQDKDSDELWGRIWRETWAEGFSRSD